MDFIKNFNWSPRSLLKAAVIIVVGAIVLSIVIALFSLAVRTAFYGNGSGSNYAARSASNYGAMPMMDSAMEPSYDKSVVSSKLSITNNVGTQLNETGQVYSENGDFEIKEYSGTIRTSNLAEACSAIETLRSVDGVIFENAVKNEDSCYYRFKILKKDEKQALTVIESLDPKDFNAQIYTIKKVIENYDTELSILKSKLESIESSLTDAQNEYQQLEKLATEQQDVENLTKIIDSRLSFITRFANERMSILEQIDRYNKSKSTQLERLLYSTFTINVYEDKIVNLKQIKDSWRYELERFVTNISSVLQQTTLGLASFLMRALQVAIYFFVGLFILKFAWVGAKRVWKTSFTKRKEAEPNDSNHD